MSTSRKGRVNLQLALDFGEESELIDLCHQLSNYIDWIEVGTPWILTDGMQPIRRLRGEFTEKRIVADAKIIDAGRGEAQIAFEAGADFVTVLGLAANETVHAALEAAREVERDIIVDLLNVPVPRARGAELADLGVKYFVFHIGHDQQEGASAHWSREFSESSVAGAHMILAGGIGPENIGQVLTYNPHTVVIGRALTAAANPVAVAMSIQESIDAFSR